MTLVQYISLGWLILISVESLGQQFITLEDSTEIRQFESYASTILNLTKDRTIELQSPAKYQLKYITNCRFSEMIYSNETLYSFHGRPLIHTREDHKENEIADFFSISHSNQIQHWPYLCGSQPSVPKQDKIMIIDLDSAFVDHEIVQHIFLAESSEKELYKQLHSPFNQNNCGYSFQQHQYLIIDGFWINSIGNQTSVGYVETWFLEKIIE